MKTREQMHIKEGLEAHHTRINMYVVTVIGLVLVEEVTMKKVLDIIKKVGNMVIIGEVLFVLRLSMIGVKRIDLEMAENLKTIRSLMEIISGEADHLSNLKI